MTRKPACSAPCFVHADYYFDRIARPMTTVGGEAKSAAKEAKTISVLSRNLLAYVASYVSIPERHTRLCFVSVAWAGAVRLPFCWNDREFWNVGHLRAASLIASSRGTAVHATCLVADLTVITPTDDNVRALLAFRNARRLSLEVADEWDAGWLSRLGEDAYPLLEELDLVSALALCICQT